jgi:hypothetical protein
VERRGVALGLKVRTGRAVVVALAGPAKTPDIVGKTRVDVAFTFEEGAVFHACQHLPIEQARDRIETSRRTFTKRAEGGLATFVAELGLDVWAAGMGVKSMAPLPPLESVLRSHPLVHAAEIGAAHAHVARGVEDRCVEAPCACPAGEHGEPEQGHE